MPPFGRIALVGSGEYLPGMAELEAALIDAGPSKRYIQIPTAAGQESVDRLKYWERIGREQADRIGAEQIFLPIFSPEDVNRQELADEINDAGLIYMSGGDPHYLAETLRGSLIFEVIERNWLAGSSLAGCSAGAMALGPDIPHFRSMKKEGDPGFSVVPHIRTIPHFDKFFKWIPDHASRLFLKAPEGIHVIGVDEMTAIITDDLSSWSVQGRGSAHILNGQHEGKYSAGSTFILS
jgi:cyanophycinase